MIVERERVSPSGWLALALLLPALFLCIAGVVIKADQPDNAPWVIFFVLASLALLVCLRGLFIVNPNQAIVLQLFGAYAGSVKQPGLRWDNPFLMRRAISQRIRNFESSILKINDHDGNPIDTAAVVVWKVVDTAEACFEVDDYEHFVRVQSEAALRNLATRYPYDAHAEGQLSLRGNTAEIADQLKAEIQNRLTKAGVLVLEARIANLSYAPEIAAAMLRRQQASAVIAARQKIVEGAVGMVEMALHSLSANKIVELDEERKAAMVSNLLVVLCAEQQAQPVINAGTLHH
ncbi:MAG TPA: SPFH domain-containing protein [Tepidisphaeraceae bacterium]|nr:SPFH domain-containing protein [Tepidisphaeraceae bacterium]